MAKVKCANCGAEFDSPFCPQCGTKRPEEMEVIEKEEKFLDDSNTECIIKEESKNIGVSKTNAALDILVLVLRWISFVFIILFFICTIVGKAPLSMIILLIPLILVAPTPMLIKLKGLIYSKLPFEIPKATKVTLCIVLFIISLCVLPVGNSSSSGNANNDKKTSQKEDIAVNTEETIDTKTTENPMEKQVEDIKVEENSSEVNAEDIKTEESTSEAKADNEIKSNDVNNDNDATVENSETAKENLKESHVETVEEKTEDDKNKVTKDTKADDDSEFKYNWITRSRMKKVRKYLRKEKYEKALKMLKKYDFGEGGNALLYEEYYIAQNDYDSAAKELINYCRKKDNLETLGTNQCYMELLRIKDKAKNRSDEIVLLLHDVKVAEVGEELGHDWVLATCTEPKTCSVCAKTVGKALGHKWVDATCTSEKYCSVCNKKEGKPLGHEVDEWKVEKEPTCSEEGVEVGLCNRCGEECREKIEKIEHTPGDWEISTAATDKNAGKRSIFCKVCGAELQSENYTLTVEEKNEYYKESCKSVSYDDLIRNPDTYENKPIKLTVRIKDVKTVDSFFFEDQYEATLGGSTISVIDDREKKEPKFRAGDTVTIYGVGRGYNTVYSYRKGAILGLPHDIETEKIPCVGVKFANIK